MTSLFLTAAVTMAHVGLLEADPAPGAELSQPPDEIHLTFGEEIEPDGSITLFDETFRRVEGIAATWDATRPDELSATVSPLKAGTYTVQWRATGEDGDTVSGSYSFRVMETKGSLVRLWPLAAAGAAALGVAILIRRARTLKAG